MNDSKEKWVLPLISSMTLISVGILATSSFSLNAKHKIRRHFGYKSAISGRTDRPLQCAHINHSRLYENHGDPSNGILLTDMEHVAMHMYFRLNPQLIGLSHENNSNAIKTAIENIQKYNRLNRLETSRIAIEKEIVAIMNKYQDYFRGLVIEA
jgi:hypothetical protein